MAPSTTAILCALGLGDSIIAADSWSEGTQGLQASVQYFDMMNPNIEMLASLECNMLFVSTMTQAGTSKDPFKPFSDTGTEVIYIPTSESIDEITKDILLIASKVNAKKMGAELVANMQAKIAEISFKTSKIPLDKRKTVYFELSPAPYLYSFGSGVFMDELLNLAGLTNIFADKKGWLSVSAESVVGANPDIIFTNINFIEDPIAEILNRTGWEGVHAVQTKQIFYIDNNASSQPAHTIVIALEEMAKKAYPELF